MGNLRFWRAGRVLGHLIGHLKGLCFKTDRGEKPFTFPGRAGRVGGPGVKLDRGPVAGRRAGARRERETFVKKLGALRNFVDYAGIVY